MTDSASAPEVPASDLASADIQSSHDAEEASNSIKVSLADLCAKGTSQYALKHYTEAADFFARASELQAELNGEMSPDNAEILFLYGRSLFKVGQSKSDVLGASGGGEKKKKSAKKGNEVKEEEEKTEADLVAEEKVAIVAEQAGSGIKVTEQDGAGPKKPLFQFTGDENFEDSDDDEEVCHSSSAAYQRDAMI
jgi:HAT1-interacting factor 1